MITHRSSVQVVGYNEVNNNKIITVLLDVPYYDLLSWLQDTNGIFSIEDKPFDKDFKDVNFSPWIPENWLTKQSDLLPYQVATNVQMIWEQMAKATSIAIQGLKEADIHESLLQKLMLPFIGRKVLLTFSESNKLFKKTVLPEPDKTEWHLPFITQLDRESDLTPRELVAVSVFRSSCFGELAQNLSLEDELKAGLELIKDHQLDKVKKDFSFGKHQQMAYAGSGFRSSLQGWVPLSELIKNQVEW